MKVLVTGATGYIGGRVVPRLLDAGFDVRAMSRDQAHLDHDPWRDQVEVVHADALEYDSIYQALDGCDAAFYLIHGMEQAKSDFRERDRLAAQNFADAAEEAGLKRIVYLGGLGAETDKLSKHLESRHEVGRILASGATPVTELRAAVIIGSGSVSFEMIRHLVELLPIMMTPRWVRTKCQPIAIRNVLDILTSVIQDEGADDHLYEIGGPDVLTYGEMMQRYAELALGKRRPVIPLPLFSPRLSAFLVGFITPLPNAIARPLIGGILNDVVVSGESPAGFEPENLISYTDALQQALNKITHDEVETRWSDALTKPAAPLPSDPAWSAFAMKTDLQIARSTAPPEDLFWAVTRIGGDVGYYAMNWAWKMRGQFDKLIGGVGLRRGRRHPEELRPGESVDFFRVAHFEPATHSLLLQAEMKVPGSAWIGWTVLPDGDGSKLVQSALFVPRGLFGRLYWWSLLPFHAPIWKRMTVNMARTAEQRNLLQRPESAGQ
jgi:uncharacterized protein YbjT (DUF2867 family)